ncbi:MAG: hypothetical protein ABIH72_02150 [archaeon]
MRILLFSLFLVVFLIMLIVPISARTVTGRFVITGEVIEGNDTLNQPQELEKPGFFEYIKNFFKKIFDFFKSDLELVLAFDVSGTFQIKYYCGDSNVNPGEECDLINLNNQTCITLGYNSGILNCTANCYFNESLCTSYEPPPIEHIGGDKEKQFPPRECNDGIDNDNDGKIDFLGDPGCTNVLDDSEFDICIADWSCSEWSSCKNSIQQRQCIDNNECEDLKIEKRECEERIAIIDFPIFGPVTVDTWFVVFFLIVLIVILILTIIIYRKVKIMKEKVIKRTSKKKKR